MHLNISRYLSAYSVSSINVRFMFAEGVSDMHNIEDYPDDKWDLLIAVNLSAPFHLTKHCLPGMKKKRT